MNTRSMKPFLIRYKDGPEDEPQSAMFRGYDASHAEERFMDSMAEEGGIEGLRVLSVTSCQKKFTKPPVRI